MKLILSKRAGDSKSELNHVRHRGDIPAVVYGKGRTNEFVLVSGNEFGTILRDIKPGCLPNSVFQVELEGKKFRAIVKDIQYHPVTYQILHLDFVILEDAVPVTVNIPLHFTGITECTGIKLGGFLRQVMRHVKVRCLPKDIPSKFEVDIRSLGIKHSKRVRDIEIPESVKSLVSANEVVVVIAKR